MLQTQYELFEEIGHGEFATVYRAFDHSPLQRYVAIKQLRGDLLQDPDQVERFWREARFLAGARHENVVEIYGVDELNGWIIMELMNGSLDIQAAQGTLTHEEVRGVVRQALQALQWLHSQGKLHGAIKPANLLIDERGRVKLSDSIGLEPGDVLHRPRGVAKYMAPELLNTKFGEIGPGIDLYGLGMTALELLVGPKFERLFSGVSNHPGGANTGWMRWHASEQEALPPSAKIVSALPADLATTVDRLLAKRVVDRFASAAEALQALEDRPAPPLIPAAPVRPRNSGPAVVPVGQVVPTPSRIPAPAPAWPPPATRSTAAATGGAPTAFTKEWINQKLENKWISYPIIGFLIAAILAAILPSGSNQKTTQLRAVRKTPQTTKPETKPEPPPPPAFSGVIRGDGHHNAIGAIDFLDDQRAVTCGEDGALHVWDVAKGEHLRRLGDVQPVRFYALAVARLSNQVSVLVAGEERSIRIINATDGRTEDRLQATDHSGPIRCLAASADGKTVISGDEKGTLIIWDLRNRRADRVIEAHTDQVRAVAICPDPRKRLAVSGSWDRTVKLWDLSGTSPLDTFQGHGGSVEGVAISRAGDLAGSASTDGTVRLWDVPGRRALGLPAASGRSESWPLCVALAPDGAQVLSGGTDGVVRLWRVDDRSEVKTFRGHAASVTRVAFLAGGRRAVSCGEDGGVGVWDLVDRPGSP
jgi:serine/threonine protein kinase